MRLLGKSTIEGRLAEFGPKVHGWIRPEFERAGISYPPASVQLLFVKSDKTLHLYASNSDERLKFIKSYKVLKASGKPGPKLEEGDGQVPEGIYRVESLNPNSAFHLSLRLNYPNEDDKRFAKQDGRTKLGSDIMIHGDQVSVGCIAIGNEMIEELFVLAAETDYRTWKVISAPVDFRLEPNFVPPEAPSWINELYSKIKKAQIELMGPKLATEPESRFIFGERESKTLVRQCSRPDPVGITGFWKPSDVEVTQLEADFDKCLTHPELQPIRRYARQYAGLKQGKNKVIYLNARLLDHPDVGFPLDDPKALCDGSATVFGVEYDTTDRTFANFYFNGPVATSAPADRCKPSSIHKRLSPKEMAAADFAQIAAGKLPMYAKFDSKRPMALDGGTIIFVGDGYEIVRQKQMTKQDGKDGVLYGPILKYTSGPNAGQPPKSDIKFYSTDDLRTFKIEN